LAPVIAWTGFFEDTGVSPVSELECGNPDFFKGMNALIESTDLDTIKTYLRWQLINGIAGTALPTALDDEDFDFFGRELSGQPEQRSPLEALRFRRRTARWARRWAKCM
jgi:putative endopeptidase